MTQTVNLDEIELTPAKFRSDMTVELVDFMGDESSIVEAARVSTKGAGTRGQKSDEGLLHSLAREEHGSPFEQTVLKFYFETPIFIDRQLVTYRTQSTNGESGRYKTMEGVFYLDEEDAPITQVGKSMDYEFEQGRPDQIEALRFVEKSTAESAWENYQKLRAYNVSKQDARKILPVSLYVSRITTANLRSWLNFVHQRVDWGDDALKRSHPQREIEEIGRKIAEVIKERYPIVWDDFVKNGYPKL